MGLDRRITIFALHALFAIAITGKGSNRVRTAMTGSSLKAPLSSLASSLIVSPEARTAARTLRRVRRTVLGLKPVINYFHQPDDPYSALTLQLLEPLRDTYAATFRLWLVPPPDQFAAPELDRLKAWSARDAERLARDHGLTAREHSLPPNLAATPEALALGEARRRRLGHYLGATFHYEGEWYWGVDRLPYLEDRLRQEGLARTRTGIVRRLDPDLSLARKPSAGAPAPRLDFYVSLRSPYSLIAAERIGALAEAHGADLRLRPLLPMVMRGLPVPKAKSFYIMRDAAREAARFNIPFGRMVDPRGVGAEKGLAVLHHAIASGKGLAFARSFLRGAFAEGMDAANEEQLFQMADRAGINRGEAVAALAAPGWRAAAEANRDALFSLGLWGAPSFRVDDKAAVWGQDRLNQVQQDLLAALPGTGGTY